MKALSTSLGIQTETETLSKQAITYHLLKEALIHQDFEPGSVLSERELCSYFGVSRPPVHNAVVQLVSDGMLRMEHEKRILVPPATPDDLHEIYEMLESIQIASRRSQQTLSAFNIRQIQQTLQQMEDAIHDPSVSTFDRYRLDNEFHAQILCDSSNKRLRKDFEQYSDQYSLYAPVMFHPNNWRNEELHTHETIFEALTQGMFSDFTQILHEHYATAFSHYLLWSEG